MGEGTRELPSAGATAPTSAANADAVWDEQKGGHVAAGSFGKIVQDLETNISKAIHSYTEWSEVQATATITGASTDVSLPDVNLANLALGTFVRVICMLKFRKIDNSDAGSNAIDGAADVQVKESAGGAYTDCIDIIDNTMDTDGASESGGDVIIGEIDVKAEVSTMNLKYNFKFDDIQADANDLVLMDVQTGIKILYTV